jgi:phosphoserine phosphatase RsbU/P
VQGADLLANVPLFSSLPHEELERLAAEMGTLELPGGAILFRTGDPGDRFYVVVEGALEVIQALDTADERAVAQRGPGEFVGEMGLLNPDGLRTASIRASQPSRLWEMTRAQFESLIRRQPALAYEVAQVLSARLTASQRATIRELREKNSQLQKAYRELQAAQALIVEKERLEKELQVARQIQMSVLPASLPRLPGLAFGAQMVPARAVGGDFYDVMALGPGKVGIAVGDVAGKGVPAALFMTQVQALLHARADAVSRPAEVLDWVNRQILSRGTPELFVTVIYGLVDAESRRFVYARAGHETPILALPGGDVQPAPMNSGQPLGLWEGSLLDEQEITLSPGSSLLLYTDGVADARDAAGESFGADGLLRTLRSTAGASGAEICTAVWQAVTAFRGDEPAYDDVTLVAVSAEA